MENVNTVLYKHKLRGVFSLHVFKFHYINDQNRIMKIVTHSI